MQFAMHYIVKMKKKLPKKEVRRRHPVYLY
jgi:hypothetical protein